MASTSIIFGYVWAFSFILMAIYFILKSNDLLERIIATTIFGNSFSIIFWISYIISSKIGGPIFHTPIITLITVISIFLFVSYLVLIVILKSESKKYYSGYSN